MTGNGREILHPVPALHSIVASRFRIDAVAGRGGMGAVYRATDLDEKRVVALKCIDPGTGDRSRFEREAQLLQSLRHPAIVRSFAHGLTPEGSPYLVMEWLEGEGLDARLVREPLSLDDSLAMIRRVAGGIALAHAQGIVHRDLKPSNLFCVDRDPARTKILDFGIARLVQPTDLLTRTGATIGTAGYMAPEQAQGRRDIDARVDIFVLGCVLFECLCGRPAFHAPNPVAMLAQVMLDRPPRLRDARPDLPEALDLLLSRMLAKDRDERLADGNALRDALARLGLDRATADIANRSPLPDDRGSSRIVSAVILHQDGAEVDVSPVETIAEGGDTRVAEGDDSTWLLRAQSVAGAYGCDACKLGAAQALVTAREAADVSEQINRVAAAALSLRGVFPDLGIALATGFSTVDDSEALAGSVVQRAMSLLEHEPQEGSPSDPSGVRLDSISARLLESWWSIDEVQEGFHLLGRRPRSQSDLRPLLGRRTPHLGRAKEVDLLLATFDECVDEELAQAILVTAPTGAGKTRLSQEVIAAIESNHPGVRVLYAGGDPVAPGSSGSMGRQLLRHAVGLSSGDPAELRKAMLDKHLQGLLRAEADVARRSHLEDVLGWQLGIDAADPSPEFRGAQHDPAVMHRWLERSFVDWLSLLTTKGPVVLVLDDLQWADRTSVDHIEAAMMQLADRALMVLALARPAVYAHFPALWVNARMQTIGLKGLSRRAAAELIRSALDETIDDERVEQMVERAGGNVFFLEELVRAAAEQSDMRLPETVLGVVQSRLERLDRPALRLLQAASCVGESFWLGTLRRITDLDEPETSQWMDVLVREELVHRRLESTFADEIELSFANGLVREAAAAMVSPAFSRYAHGVVARWLVEKGTGNPLIVARHFERAGHDHEMAPWLVRAAERALFEGDLASARDLAAQAEEVGVDDETAGTLAWVLATVTGWSGDWAAVHRHSDVALAHLESGSVAWCYIVAGQAWSAVCRGRPQAALGRLSEMVLHRDRLVAAGPTGTALFMAVATGSFAGPSEAVEMAFATFRELASRPDAEPAFKGWHALAEAELAGVMQGHLGAALHWSKEALRRFIDAGDPMGEAAAWAQGTGWYEVAGQWEEALRWAQRGIECSKVTGAALVEDLARMRRAIACLRSIGDGDLMVDLQALSKHESPIVAAPALIGFIEYLLQQGLDAEAETAIAGLRAAPMSYGPSSAAILGAELALRRGDPERALRLVQETEDHRSRRAFLRLVPKREHIRVQALHQLGALGEARAAAKQAMELFESIAAGMQPDDAAIFLARPELAVLS